MPPKAVIQLCQCSRLDATRVVQVKPPLTVAKVCTAAKNKFKGFKAARVYDGWTGDELLPEDDSVSAALDAAKLLVCAAKDGWAGAEERHQRFLASNVGANTAALEPEPEPEAGGGLLPGVSAAELARMAGVLPPRPQITFSHGDLVAHAPVRDSTRMAQLPLWQFQQQRADPLDSGCAQIFSAEACAAIIALAERGDDWCSKRDSVDGRAEWSVPVPAPWTGIIILDCLMSDSAHHLPPLLTLCSHASFTSTLDTLQS